MNLIWWNQAKWYCSQVEDPAFFRAFNWIQTDLGYKDKPITNEEKYMYVEMDDKDLYADLEKWGLE